MEGSSLSIALLYVDLIPDEVIKEIQNESNGLPIVNLQIEKRKSQSMAGLEWLMPTALTIYILKPYTTVFLQEMGKDHFHAIKNLIITGAKKLIGKDKLIPIKVVTSSNFPKKLSGNYSVTFSVLIKISEKDKMKFLFDESLSKEELEEYAENIADFVINNSTKTIMKIIKENGIIHIINTILYTYDRKTKELIVLDPIPKRIEE